jgi:hypothetical protein
VDTSKEEEEKWIDPKKKNMCIYILTVTFDWKVYKLFKICAL